MCEDDMREGREGPDPRFTGCNLLVVFVLAVMNPWKLRWQRLFTGAWAVYVTKDS